MRYYSPDIERQGGTMRRMAGLASVLAALALISGGVTLSSRSAQAAPIELVTGNNYFPYADQSLPQGGLAAAIVTRVFAEMGFEARYAFEGWDEGYAHARDGHYIATFPYVVTPARKRDFLFTQALFDVRPTLFWNVERRHRFMEIGDLAGKSLCVPDGWAVDTYLVPLVNTGQVTRVGAPSMRACFQKMYDGAVDLVSADRRVGGALAATVDKREWTKNRRFSDESNSNHLMFTRKHPQAAQWVRTFDETLTGLRESGALYTLIRDYYAAQ